MRISVKFFGVFRSITDKTKVTIDFKDAVPLKEVVKEVANITPRLNRTLIDPDLEDPRPNTLILVNGREVSVLDGLETMLKDGDEVVFIPVLHTG